MAHETFVTNMRMGLNMVVVALLFSLLLQVLFLALLIVPKYKAGIGRTPVPASGRPVSLRTLQIYCLDFSCGFSPQIVLPDEFVALFQRPALDHFNHGGRVERRLFCVVANAALNGALEEFRRHCAAVFGWSLWAYLFAFGYIIYFLLRSAAYPAHQFVRGAEILSAAAMRQKMERFVVHDASGTVRLNAMIGELPFPLAMEYTHLLVCGTTGAGKSVFLNQWIGQICARQAFMPNKLVVYDIKGEFLAKHARPDDVIFYPFDRRSIRWRFFNEISAYPDFDILSTSLFQPPEFSKDEYWYTAARDVFRGGLVWLYRHQLTSNRDVLCFFNQAADEIKNRLCELPPEERGAVKHIDKPDSGQATSVLAVIQERIGFFKYLTDLDGDFSFRQFVRDGGDQRHVFLMNIKENEMIFKPLMSFVIDIMIREVLSRPDCAAQQRDMFTFVIDEFGSLGKLSSIFSFLTMGRSKGGSLVVANQDLGSVTTVYGEAGKSTFFNNFNANIVFRLNDPTTAEFLSKALGQQEAIKKFDSHQLSPDSVGDRFSLNSQEKLDAVVLPSELMNLRDFELYVKVAGIGLAKTTIPKRFFTPALEPYCARPFDLGYIRDYVPPAATPPQPAPPTAGRKKAARR